MVLCHVISLSLIYFCILVKLLIRVRVVCYLEIFLVLTPENSERHLLDFSQNILFCLKEYDLEKLFCI